MFTYEEIIKDWQKLGDATTLIEKSELSNKYNAKSNSKKVIETAIIAEMNNVRKNKENFTIKDVVWFNRNISSTDNYKKLSQLLSNENSSFVEFYKNYYYNKLVERKLINVNIKNMSALEKYIYKTYLNINRFIEENSSEYKKAIDEKCKIAEILTNELEKFYKECIIRTKKYSTNFYNNVFPLNFENAKNNCENAKKKFNEVNDKLNSMLNNNNHSDASKFIMEVYSAKAKYQKKMSAYLKLKHFKNKYPTVQDFVDYSLKELENRHNKNIITLADRINRKHINIEKMKVISVKVDPNLYDMTITDDVEYLHCRSIWCAQYSDKVTPHYRFVIS